MINGAVGPLIGMAAWNAIIIVDALTLNRISNFACRD